MDEVRVIDIRSTRKSGPLRAFADVKVGSVLVRDFRVLQDGAARPYVRAPYNTYKNPTGELCFRQIVDLPDEVRGRVDTAILSAFYREKEQHYGHQPK